MPTFWMRRRALWTGERMGAGARGMWSGGMWTCGAVAVRGHATWLFSLCAAPCSMRLAFQCVHRYAAQHTLHAQLLATFSDTLAAVGSIALPAQLADPRLGWRVLADVAPTGQQRLNEWAASCAASHEAFAAKVSELEGSLRALQHDVERLFLAGPSVDLDALGTGLGQAEAHIDEQGSAVQVGWGRGSLWPLGACAAQGGC